MFVTGHLNFLKRLFKRLELSHHISNCKCESGADEKV